MRDEINYEWCIRTFDEHGDIIDNDFDDCLDGYLEDDLKDAITENGPTRLELVKYVGNEVEGTKTVEYAEVSYGELYGEFTDGHRVPRRFRDHLATITNELRIKPEDYAD